MKKLGYLALAFAFPALAFAQIPAGSAQSLGAGVITFINNVAVPLLFAIAFLVFIWGIFQYFIQGGADEEKRESGKSLMLWGIIGFFIMVSVWGLVNILRGSFSFNSSIPTVTDIPTTNI